MVRDDEVGARDLDMVILDRDLNISNLFLYRIYSHGGCILKGVVGGVREHLSLVEWVDYIVDEPILERYISNLEKRVFREFYRLKPTPILYITLYSGSCRELENVIKAFKYIKITTTQWYTWRAKPIYAHGVLYDFLNTYSSTLPSIYKPVYQSLKIPAKPPDICYYNDFSSVKYRFINVGKSIQECRSEVLFPPNFFGVGGDPSKYIFIEFRYDYTDLDPGESIVRKYIYLIEYRLKGISNAIFPIMYLDGNIVKCGFILVEDGNPRYVAGYIFDGDGYIVDLSGRKSSGRRYVIYFKDFWSKITKKGLSMSINIGFREFKPSPSHIFPELRYGGKIFYSPSSKPGYKIFRSD